MSDVEESPTCAHLYYQKQVLYWHYYQVGGLKADCKFSLPTYSFNNEWIQDGEKIAKSSIMFADKLSREDPSQGVYFTNDDLIEENLWESTTHPVQFPWTQTSGFIHGTWENKLYFHFGRPERSALIWGLRFLKSQLIQLEPVTIYMRYSYYKDMERDTYPDDGGKPLRHPNRVEDDALGLEIRVSDLDEDGIYYLKDDEDPSKPLMFVASSILFNAIVEDEPLNFDFVGSFFDFEVASTGLHPDGKEDGWNTRNMENFFIKGIFYIYIYAYTYISLIQKTEQK